MIQKEGLRVKTQSLFQQHYCPLFCLLFFLSCSILGNAFFCTVLNSRLLRLNSMRHFVSLSLEIFHLETGEKSVSVVTSPLAVTRPGRGRGRQKYYPQYFPPCLTRHKLQQVLQTLESSD